MRACEEKECTASGRSGSHRETNRYRIDESEHTLLRNWSSVMKTFGLGVLAALGGYIIGMLSGMFLIEAFSSNRHDRSMETAMTGAFVMGPMMAVIAVIVVVVIRTRRAH
jgi:hypothetical protein